MSARRTADVLVIGGGPAGAAAACRLAAGGCRVRLLERDTGPRPRVCGEFLSAAACAELAALGVRPPALGAVPIKRLCVVHEAHRASAALPAGAAGLSRETLDAHLLAHALACGVEVEGGAAVRRLERYGALWRATLADGTVREAPQALLATGKHDLRGHARPRGPMIGFKLPWHLAPAQAAGLAGRIELVLFDGGYAGLQPVEGGCVNLCLVIRVDAFARLGRSWPGLLAHLRAAPYLDTRLRDARPVWPRPATIAAIPYGYVHGGADPDLYRLGDQFAVIPSFAGEGIAIALRTARLAAAAVLAGAPAAAYHTAARREVLGPVRAADRLGSLAEHALGRRLALRLARLPGVLPALARVARLPPDFAEGARNARLGRPFMSAQGTPGLGP